MGIFEMLQLLLTGLAGIGLGIVIMRLLQKPQMDPVNPEAAITTEPAPETLANSENPKRFDFAKLSRTQMTFGAAAGLMVVAGSVAVFRPTVASSIENSAVPLATTAPTGGKPAALDDVDTMITRLAERLKTETTDGEGFRMLGWSYVNTGHPTEAVEAYVKAVALLPARADVHAGYGEALVAVAKDNVTNAAKAQFEQALRIDPKEPRARFFMSLHKAQNGDERAALDEWIALSNDAPADLPWQADVRSRIEKLATKFGVDAKSMLKPNQTSAAPASSVGPDANAMKAASALPAAQQASMIDGMVAGLAAKLQANPSDADGWVKLIRSRVVLKDMTRANDDLAMARKALATDPAKLGQINATAKELGL
jgi:cytochrome c-type biogenesis protein CcmH